MFDIAFLDKAAYWVNLTYIALVCLTLATSVVVVFISHQRAAFGGTDTDTVQKEAEARIAAANQQAAEANQRAAAMNAEAAKAQAQAAEAALAEAKLRKENLQLGADLEHERTLRQQSEQKTDQQPAAPQTSGQQPTAQQLPAQQPAARQTPEAAEAQNPQPSTEPRVLSALQEESLLSGVRQFAQKHVTIVELGDSEAGSLARQIVSVLEMAGWQVFVSPVGALVPPQYGVVCTHNSGDAAAAALVAGLRSANVIVYDRTEMVDQFQIIVGLKPQ